MSLLGELCAIDTRARSSRALRDGRRFETRPPSSGHSPSTSSGTEGAECVLSIFTRRRCPYLPGSNFHIYPVLTSIFARLTSKVSSVRYAYRPRIVDAELDSMLSTVGAVLLEGPRACGKTATGEAHSKSAIRLDVDEEARALAEIDPGLILNGETPRLIDEWQLEPRVWNHVRRAVDDRRQPGQFILTGSAVPADDAIRHSGAGRIVRIRMRPMTLFESGHSSGSVSLGAIMRGDAVPSGGGGMPLHDTADRLCVGGWPALQEFDAKAAQRVLTSYLSDVARVDVSALDGGVRRDPDRVRRLMASLARNVSTQASAASLARDTGDDGTPLRIETVGEYLDALERVMVVENQPSWGPHLRSRDIVRAAAKRHFIDPSLAVAAMGASPERLLKDPKALGFLFESLVVRDLRVYAQALGGEVRHYRDSAGTEVDAVVTLADGTWAPIEVKLGASQIDAAAASLGRFLAKVDTAQAGEPAARLVITAGEYTFTRLDGITVVPLSLLAP